MVKTKMMKRFHIKIFPRQFSLVSSKHSIKSRNRAHHTFWWAIKQKAPGKFLQAFLDWVQEAYEVGENLGYQPNFHHKTITTPNERGS